MILTKQYLMILQGNFFFTKSEEELLLRNIFAIYL